VDPSRVAVGRVVKPHGIRGAVRVLPISVGSHALDEATAVYIVQPGCAPRAARVAESTPFSAGWVVVLEGVPKTREAADALRGARLEIDRALLPLAPGEFFVADLPGCEAFDPAGAPLGTVVEILPLPAHDVIVLRTVERRTAPSETGAPASFSAAGEKKVERERMVPLVPAFVVSVDVATRRVVLDPPEEDE
jgi:16S rRNA processing protein RimM